MAPLKRALLQGMTLVPSVTELILAELLYLQYEDNLKPIYLYINSTCSSKVGMFWLKISKQNVQPFYIRTGKNMVMTPRRSPSMIR